MSTFTKNEKRYLYSYLSSCKNYLEFGSGESTIYASSCTSIELIDSVESSRSFVKENLIKNNEVSKAMANGRLHFHIIEIGEITKWGYPRDDLKKHLWPNYSLSVFENFTEYDLVLIDGRFRVACALNCILNTNPDCKIIIHDFWNRSQYHLLLDYLDVVDKTDKLGVFTKNDVWQKNRKKIQRLIKKYQYLPDDRTFFFKVKNKFNFV